MYEFGKRIFDIIGSIIGIIILIPLSFVIKIIFIFNHDYDTIFYSQIRIGKNGKAFKLYKYRTMIIDADQKLDELLKNPEIKKEYLYSYKLKNDPRLTKVGKILRRTSFDEFPQFFNVLIGNMSLVGPRPVIPKETNKFGKNKSVILSVKPGITGNWAVNGRSDLTYKDRTRLEKEYVEKRNFWFDLKIICKTFAVVIKRDGAK